MHNEDCFEELTIVVRIVKSVDFDLAEKLFRVLCIIRSPESLERVKSAQRLESRIFKPALSIPESGLPFHRAGQKVCVVNCVHLGAFKVSLCILEFAWLGKHLCQGVMYPKQLIDHVERGGNPQGYLQMVNGLLCLALALVYFAESAMACAGPKRFAFVQEKIYCT